jgi:hypothetical protein
MRAGPIASSMAASWLPSHMAIAALTAKFEQRSVKGQRAHHLCSTRK